jgi:archaetidylinositol phosphate synthase
MLSIFKPKIEKRIHHWARYFVSVDPNLLTLIGSIPPLLFFVFVINSYYYLALIVFPFLIIDLLDGTVARMSGRSSAFGAFLDSTIDRISDFLLISAFGFGKIVRWEIVTLFILAAFLVSYTRSRGELASNRQISFDLGLIERTERLIGIFFALILYIIVPPNVFSLEGVNVGELVFIFLFILSFITFLQRVIWAYKKL